MTNKFLKITNDDGLDTLINVDKIISLQAIKYKRRFMITYRSIDAMENEIFDNKEDCINKFHRVNNLTKGRLIGTENAEPDIFLMSVNIELASLIRLDHQENRDHEYYGKGFIKYFFRIGPNPFTENIVVAEMFDSHKDARKVFHSMTKSLCFIGMELIESSDTNDTGEKKNDE